MPTSDSGPILVVDDEEVVGKFIGRFFEKKGYPSVVCRSSQEAFAAAQSRRPALLISDYNLPCCENGLELCLALRQQKGWDIPIIIISGEAQNAALVRERGFEFLPKPLTGGALWSAVERHLKRPLSQGVPEA